MEQSGQPPVFRCVGNQTGANVMPKSRGPLIGVLLGVAAIVIAVVASSAVSPAAGASADRARVAAQPDDGEPPRCLTWRRSSPTKAYNKGRTAGYSWAWNKVVGPGPPGGSTTRVNRVKEIQCLLDYRGYWEFLLSPSPPPMEFWQPWGYYGYYTTAMDVHRAQVECGIDADGVVGPATWRCLRRDKNW
jgi:peptidoglycan hydrolase-like protein with peptidoglycan-binding domain